MEVSQGFRNDKHECEYDSGEEQSKANGQRRPEQFALPIRESRQDEFENEIKDQRERQQHTSVKRQLHGGEEGLGRFAPDEFNGRLGRINFGLRP